MDNEPKNKVGGYIVGIVIIALLIIGVSVWSGKKQPGPPAETGTGVESAPVPVPTEGNGNLPPVEHIVETSPKTVEVSYTDNGFSPASISIKTGDTITFLNKSSEVMWVGSNEHPTHAIYAGTNLREHCPDTASAAFDQCGRSDTYSFIFKKVGSWEYHNHANPRMTGMVAVE